MTETQLQQTNANLLARRAAEGDPRRAKTIAATLAKLKPLEVRKCDCGGEIVLDNLPPTWRDHATKCEACAAKDRTQQAQKLDADKLAAKWKTFCPADYQSTDINRLPCSKETLRTVLGWKFSQRGLILHGPTGKGKSRCAWLLLGRESAAGRSIDALNSMDLSFKLPGLYAKGADQVDAWLRQVCAVDLLLLDDCFKAVLNDRTEAFLFALLSHRSEHHRPVIATLNDTSESLKARLTADRSDPMLRRLTEYADVVNFG